MNEATNVDDLYLYFLICWAFILIGTAIVYSTWRRVKFFVDPSADMLLGLSGVLLKKLLGAKGLTVYWYVIGTICLIVGSAGFVMGLRRFLFGLGQ